MPVELVLLLSLWKIDPGRVIELLEVLRFALILYVPVDALSDFTPVIVNLLLLSMLINDTNLQVKVILNYLAGMLFHFLASIQQHPTI